MPPAERSSEMHWFWMNIPPIALIFVIWTGVPLWLVLKHPDTAPESGVPGTPSQAQLAGPTAPEAGDVYRPRHASGSRVLAGTPR
jgi:hypothetical protein